MMKNLKFICTRQLKHPEGTTGKLAGYIMNLINVKQNRLTFKALDIDVNDYILEIGFGNGKYIKKAAKSASKGFVAGIDHSQTMVEEAARRNKEFIKKAVVEIKLGSIEKIPYEDEMFNKVFSVNTIYFWPEPEENLKEIYRVLKTGGQMAVTFNSKDSLKKTVGFSCDFVLYEKQEVIDLLLKTGFKDVKLLCVDGKYSSANCVTGVK